MQRPFTSGSRQAPDPFDQFLEENNFYRKHTARDSSCLFRTISEQMYDTQLHHLTNKRNLCRFPLDHSEYYFCFKDRKSPPKLFNWNTLCFRILFRNPLEFTYTYKPTTCQSHLKNTAYFVYFMSISISNILSFCEKLVLKQNSSHVTFTDVFRVFYTPERHFDSVFTSDYIKDVAICQSICYEIIYKDLFKLPDVTFAVEQMLHSNTLDTSNYHTECNEDGYCTQICMEDGRTFDFDLPDKTFCILENYRLCHFHNSNFPRFSEDLQRDLKVTKREDTEHKFLSKTVDSLLPDKYLSCVRQLLLEGITPFPYKVAKALDPNMYRNIEFDSWNEARKEMKLQNWYNGDSNFKLMKYEKRRVHTILQVGAKCHVRLCKPEPELYTCHIQEMSVEKGYCVVFIEQLGERRLVPYDSLKPLPPDQFKPWSLPYRLQRHIQKCNTYRYARQFNYRLKVDEQFTTNEYCLPDMKASFDDDDPKQHNCIYKMKQFTHLENFRTHTMEYCTMPLTVEHARDHMQDNKSQRNESSRAPSQCSEIQKAELDVEHGGGVLEGEQDTTPEGQCIYPVPAYGEEYFSYGFDPSIIQAGPQTIMAGGGPPIYYMCNGAAYTQSGGMYMQAPPPPQVIATAQNPSGYYPQYYSVPHSSGSGGYTVTPSIQRQGQLTTTPLTGRINLDVKKSVKVNGSDLPVDLATLRYFFNMGVEYHQKFTKNELAIDSKEGILKISPDSQVSRVDENGNNLEVKPDSNSNISSSNSNNYSNKTSNNQRRFPSRYFNNKDRQNYRSGPQNNRYHQNDYNNGSGKGQKANSNHQSQNISTPNSRNSSSTGNHPRPGSGNPLSVAELGIQTSPMITFGTVDNNDMIQTPNGQVVTSYFGSYVHDFEQPPPQSSGVYMPMQVAPAGYGIYAAPPTMGAGPVTMHTTGGYPYMSAPPPTAVPLHSPAHAGPPPSQITPTAFYTSNTESGGTTLIDGAVDPNQYPCVGYPPPVQFFYSPSNGVPGAAGTAGGSAHHQGYWCIPPPMQAQQSPQAQAVAIIPSTNNPAPPTRRDMQTKQQHSSLNEQ